MSDVRAIGAGPAPDGKAAERRKLREVADEFEALFMRTLLRSMRSTVMESDLLNHGGDTKMYRQLYDEELARKVSARGGLGIAEMVIRQYGREIDAEKAGSGAKGTEAPGGTGVAPVQGPPTAAEALQRYREAGGGPAGAVAGIREALRTEATERAAAWRAESAPDAAVPPADGTEMANGPHGEEQW